MGCVPFATSDFWITLWAHLVWLGCYHGGSTAVGCWPSVIGVQPFAVGGDPDEGPEGGRLLEHSWSEAIG